MLARKYRPQSFDDLIGQEAMVKTLRNAFASGRIAQAYMLTGVRGVGKTTTARIIARALNYETDTVKAPTIDMPALGRHCAEIMESRHPDVIEMDAASNTGVDNIRELIESARYTADHRAHQGLHHRRSPHAVEGRLQRASEDARGAAASTSSSSSRRPRSARCR